MWRLAAFLILVTGCVIAGFEKDTCTKGKGKCGSGTAKSAFQSLIQEKAASKKNDTEDRIVTKPRRIRYQTKIELELVKKWNQTKSFRTIDEKCSERNGMCYQVVDWFYNDEPTHRGYEPYQIVRFIQTKGANQPRISESPLYKPDIINWKTFDSKKWPADHGTVYPTGIQAMIQVLSGSQTLPKPPEGNDTMEETYNLLMIGGGADVFGRYITTYPYVNLTVVENEPLMVKLAKKWFGLAEGPNHHVVIQDGIQYIYQALKRKEKYDAVIIDACHNRRRKNLCPTEDFLDRSVIQAYKNLLKPKGIAIIYIKSTDRQWEKNVVVQHDALFPACYEWPDSEENVKDHVIVCENRPDAINIWTNNNDRHYFIANSSYYDYNFN